MIRRMRFSALGLLAVSLATPGSIVMLAQHPPTPVEPTTPRIRIDAVVTDRTRSPILDLKAGDFELLENGVAQKIESVELRTRRGSSAAEEASPILSAGDETRAARQPGTRVFALFLDEFHISPGATSERVRAALSAFIDRQLQPGDLALAIKPLDSLTSLRFTRDRGPLRAAIESLAGRKGDLAPRTPFEEQYIGRAPAAVALARAQISTAVLRELALKFGELEADRGVFVIVSEGFPRVNTGRLSRNSDVQGVVRAASRFNTAMYTFNPADQEDVGVLDPTKNDTPAGMLQWLAVQTGGRVTPDGRALETGLRQMTDDLDAYYVLTYQPGTTDGRFHTVEVKAKRRDAQVRTPPGYWAPLASEWRTALASSRTLTPRRALHRSGIIDIWTGITRDADGRLRLNVTWEPRLTLARPPHVVVLKAQTSAGVRLFEGQINQVGVRGATVDRAIFNAPPGRIELDMTIQSIEGATLDTDSRDVEVPAFDARTHGPVFLTPEVIRARTVRELNAARTDPDATPTPDRSFSRSDQLLIRAPTWDGTGVPVQVTAYVLNRWGQPMRPVAQTDASGVPQFELPLSWLAAGDYFLSLTAKNANGQAVERLDIKVNR